MHFCITVKSFLKMHRKFCPKNVFKIFPKKEKTNFNLILIVVSQCFFFCQIWSFQPKMQFSIILKCMALGAQNSYFLFVADLKSIQFRTRIWFILHYFVRNWPMQWWYFGYFQHVRFTLTKDWENKAFTILV